MRKVAFFAEIMIEDFDGASRTMFQLINRIDKSQFDYLFVYGDGPTPFRDYRSFKVPTLSIPVNKEYSLAVPQLIANKLENYLDQFAPDVIHIASPSLLGFFALNYAKRREIPVLSIYHTHFVSYIGFYLNSFKSLIKPTEQWFNNRMLSFYNRCDKVYVPTLAMQIELETIGIQKELMTLWQRGIDQRLFNPSKKNPNLIQKTTENDKPNILFASRLVWEKNLRTLIGIYQFLQQKNMEVNFIIIGDGKAKEAAQEQMPNAYFLGKKSHEELAIFYASADVFVFPSTSETYGNVIIEAMASGLPCVIADEGGSSSLVQHQVNGFQASAFAVEDYAKYIGQLLTDKNMKNKIIKKALEDVKQLDWEYLAQHYFDEISNLATKRNFNRQSLVWAN